MTATTVAEVFAALGDPNRQRILEQIVAQGRASATTLAAPLAVTRQAVDKHLRVLKRAGIIAPVRSGREVLYALPARSSTVRPPGMPGSGRSGIGASPR